MCTMHIHSLHSFTDNRRLKPTHYIKLLLSLKYRKLSGKVAKIAVLIHLTVLLSTSTPYSGSGRDAQQRDLAVAGTGMKRQTPGDFGVLTRGTELLKGAEVIPTHPAVIGSISTHAHIITAEETTQNIHS